MSDMTEYWRDVKPFLKQQGADRRASNRASSAKLLEKSGISFESKNEGAHLIVRHGDNVCDFWPGTGKWAIRKGASGRGVFSLLRRLKVQFAEGST